MDSVGTKSYRQRSAETLGFEAPAPHIVVVCPSCKTSFAVETAAVAALETPRFHCSRCDDIFVMKDAPSDMLPLGGVQVQSITNPGSQGRNIQTRGRAPAPESIIQSSDFSLGDDSTYLHNESLYNESTSLEAKSTHANLTNGEPPKHTKEQPTTQRSELSLLNRSLDESEPEGVESESVDWESFFEPPALGTARKSSDIPAAPPPPTKPSSRQFVLSDPPPAIGDPSPGAPRRSPPETQRNPQPLRSSIPKEAHVAATEAYRPSPRRTESSSDRLSTDSAGIAGRLSARMQGLISLSLPILGALSLFLCISYCARLSPQSIDALANLATPSVIQDSSLALPPSALTVRNLSLSFEKTRNKEIVPVARGILANDSTKSFDDVQLEVIGFNARGEIIASSKAPLRSALSNEKVSNLSLDAVRRYQSSLSTKSSLIGGQERAPFAIALLNGRHTNTEGGPSDFDPSQVRYFSARIFSVKK